MALSTDVRLPREYKADFPDRCVVCGSSCPDSKVTLITGTIGWWTWVLWAFGMPVVIRAPACRWCSWRLHLARFASLAVMIVVSLVALLVVWPKLGVVVTKPFVKWAMMGVVLLCLSPQILFEIFYPRSFDVTAYTKQIEYEFTNFNLAFEFALLNLGSGDVLFNGHSFPSALLDSADEDEADENESEEYS